MTISSINTVNTTLIVDNTTGLVDPADVRVLGESVSGVFPLATTASFTFDLTQRGAIVNCTHATVTITATIPTNASVPFDIGTVLSICKRGAAITQFAGPSVTLVVPHTLICSAVGSEMSARKDAIDTWIIGGDST